MNTTRIALSNGNSLTLSPELDDRIDAVNPTMVQCRSQKDASDIARELRAFGLASATVASDRPCTVRL